MSAGRVFLSSALFFWQTRVIINGMDPYWQLLVPQVTCLHLNPERISAHPALKGLKAGQSVLICERDPRLFLDYFFGALFHGCHVWCISPEWGERRREASMRLSGAARVLGDQAETFQSYVGEQALPEECAELLDAGQPAICIPTGGSSGQLRFAVHSWDTLSASAHGFLEYFAEESHRPLCVLPLYHVGGLMQAVRTLLSGGDLTIGNPSDPKAGLPRDFDPEGRFLSLVPTQLKRLLESGDASWLKRFKAVVISGGAVDNALLDRAHAEGLELYVSYGMTETAAMVSILDAKDFRAGKRGVGFPLPHASISVVESPDVEQPAGRLLVHAASLCHGLIPGGPLQQEDGLLTNDLGYFDADGALQVIGRADRVMITGGMKVDPAEIEKLLLESGMVTDVFIRAIPSPEWGQSLEAHYVPADEEIDEGRLGKFVRTRLSPIHVPKRWVRVGILPRTIMGKIDAARLDRTQPLK